jgi:lysophospholipase L1-like esterase
VVRTEDMITLQEIVQTIKTKNKFWIAFVGDSITSCEWVHPNWREIADYVLKSELEDLFDGEWKIPSWGMRCFNFGYDGAKTTDILEKIDDIKLIKPDLVISLMGGNDRRKLSVEEHVKNIEKIIEKLNTTVVWCSSIYGAEGSRKNDEYKPFAMASMKIKTNKRTKLIDLFDIYKDFPINEFYTFKADYDVVGGFNKNNIDDAHPNQLGNAYIAKIILKKVFGVEFDPEKYIADTINGSKYPEY